MGSAGENGIKSPSGFQGPNCHLFALVQAPWGSFFPEKVYLEFTGEIARLRSRELLRAKAAKPMPRQELIEGILFHVTLPNFFTTQQNMVS